MSAQDFIDHALAALPRWFVDSERPKEEIKAFAEIFATAEEQIAFWKSMAFILTANEGPPDWLNQHAMDRGTSRILGESNDSLRARIRSIGGAIDPASVTAYIQTLYDASGLTGTVYSLELVSGRAYMSSWASDSGVGGVFSTLSGNERKFTPTTKFQGAPWDWTGNTYNFEIQFTGAANAVNDGAHIINQLDDAAVVYTDPSFVAGSDPTVAWTRVRFDIALNQLDGWHRAYFTRGDRMGSSIPTIVIIFPYGTTQEVADSVVEGVRQKKAGGVRILAEIRGIP